MVQNQTLMIFDDDFSKICDEEKPFVQPCRPVRGVISELEMRPIEYVKIEKIIKFINIQREIVHMRHLNTKNMYYQILN